MSADLRSISAFRQAVDAGASIICYKDGSWDCRWKITQIIRGFLGWEEDDDIQIARFFKTHLKYREVRSETFTNRFVDASYDELTLTAESIKGRLRGYIEKEAAYRHSLKYEKRTLLQKLETFDPAEPQENRAALDVQLKRVKEALKEAPRNAAASRNIKKLEKHLLAFNLRSVPQEILFPKSNKIQAADKEWLKEKLKKWKSRQFPKLGKKFSREENDRINLTCSLPDVLKLLKTDPLYRENYIRFVFRNSIGACEANHAVNIAVQTPTIQKRLTKAFLDKRAKRLKNQGLLFHEYVIRDGSKVTVKKDVSFLIRGSHVSLIDDSQKITFHDGSTKKVRQLFKEEFEEKDSKISKYEYLADGIDLIREPDLTNKEYWKDLQEWETLTRDELQRRYPNVDLSNAYGLITVKASRQHTNQIRVDGNHAWFEVAVPRDDGRFTMLTFGKLAQTFPISMKEKFAFVFNTKKSTIICPDDNEFYYHREHFAEPLCVEKKHFERFFERLRQDMLKVKAGTFIFQAQGDNCASWVQEVLDEVFKEIKLPRVFEVESLKTSAPFPVNHIIDTLNYVKSTVSTAAANDVRLFICGLFGASWQGLEVPNSEKERIVKYLSDHAKFREGIQSIPSMLFHTGESLQRAVHKAARSSMKSTRPSMQTRKSLRSSRSSPV
jgi:hypothetical protein